MLDQEEVKQKRENAFNCKYLPGLDKLFQPNYHISVPLECDSYNIALTGPVPSCTSGDGQLDLQPVSSALPISRFWRLVAMVVM